MREKGFVLITVLIVITLITLLTVQIFKDAEMELQMSAQKSFI